MYQTGLKLIENFIHARHRINNTVIGVVNVSG